MPHFYRFLPAVVETTVFRDQRIRKCHLHLWRVWRFVFFMLPLLLLLAYIGYQWNSFLAVYEMKSFSLSERIGTQLIALWHYLSQAFIPNIQSIGPFQDDFPIHPLTSPLAIFACITWIVLIAAAFKFRNRYWPILFAVSWYLTGHLLESTLLPLELYFEHRNYIPIIGPLAILRVAGVVNSFISVGCHIQSLAAFFLLLWRVTKFLVRTTSSW